MGLRRCWKAAGAGMWLVLWMGCSPPYFSADEVRRSITIDWGPQQERGSLEEVLGECEEGLRMKFGAGVFLKFVSDPTPDCRSGHDRVAGCWIHDFDLVLLAPARDLAETALCHEMLHRQLFLNKRDPDHKHLGPEWALLGSVLQALRESPSEEESATR